MGQLPESLIGFVDEVDSTDKTLLVLNRRKPKPLVDILSEAFENQTVSVRERQIPEGTDDVVCLVHDGKVTAMTTLSALEKAFLMVNVDRYRTGTRQSELGTFPRVLTGLDDVEFTVSGFPDSTKEKLILIVISRFIEHRALNYGSGELHSTFQRLSRLDDEYGTRRIYEAIAATDVDTHVYGVEDDPSAVRNMDITVHEGRSEPYRRSWVVVFTPDGEPADSTGNWATPQNRDDSGHVALVAIETGPNVWRSIWTYDTARVERIQTFVRERF